MPLYLLDGQLLAVDSALAASENCCCEKCWETTHTFPSVEGEYRDCDPQIKDTTTISIPDWVCLPANALVTWAADDDIAIDGTRLGGGCVATGGTKRVLISNRSIKVDLIDTVGVHWGGTITIKICRPDDCAGG